VESEKTEHSAVLANLKDRHASIVRMQNYEKEAKRQERSTQLRRQAAQERLVRAVVDQTLKDQRETLRIWKAAQKEKREEEIKAEKMKLEAKQKYLQDRVEMMKEELQRTQEERRIQELAAKEVFQTIDISQVSY
jgi:hypothetical protein